MAQTTTGVTAGNDATESWADAVVADFTDLYATTYGPFDSPAAPTPYLFEIMPTSGVAAFSVGGFNSNGWLNNGHPYCVKDHFQTTRCTQLGQFTTTSTSVGNVAGNIPILLPPHKALTVTRISGIISIGSANSSASYNAIIESVDIILIKVNESTGAETTLGSETNVAIGTTITGQTVRADLASFDVSLNAGAGYALLATERLGIRIKVYGRSSNAAGTAYFTINGVPGSLYNNAYGLPCASRIVFEIS